MRSMQWDSKREVQSPGSGSGSPPVVFFSLLYQLNVRACSLTARNSMSPNRISGSSTSPGRVIQEEEPSTPQEARHRHHPPLSGGLIQQRASNLSCGHARRLVTRQKASSTCSPPPLPTGADRRAENTAADAGSLPLLSTLDRRELSKTIVRDAVYARVLDLVPARQCIQTAVWTLSAQVIQFDGAVLVCDEHLDDDAMHQVVERRDGGGLRGRLRRRILEMVSDAALFAVLLQPYLGPQGCHGHVVWAAVDGTVLELD